MIVRAAVAALVLSLGITASPAQALQPAPTVTPQWTTADRARVDWTAVGGPTAYYRVLYATNPDFTGGVKKVTAARTIVLTSLQASTTYHVKVMAINVNSVAVSGWSVPQQFTTKAPPVPLQVGTYNVKNPSSDNPFPWDNRKGWIAQGILSEKVAVLGLQELYQAPGRRQLLDEVNRLAGGNYYNMSEGVDEGGTDAKGYDNRILYDTRLVTLEDNHHGYGRYSAQAPGDTGRWYNWAIFRHKKGNQPRFLVANTHLSPESDAVDVAQWKYLADRAGALANYFNVKSVIVVGDFNSTKFESPSANMLKYMYAKGYGDVLGQTYRSYTTSNPRAQQKIDAWIGSSNRGNRDMRTFSVSKDKNSNSIDWIFASNQLQVPRYRVYAKYTYPLLHPDLPSDHQLVTAKILLP